MALCCPSMSLFPLNVAVGTVHLGWLPLGLPATSLAWLPWGHPADQPAVLAVCALSSCNSSDLWPHRALHNLSYQQPEP